jgi:hypothetical protein
MIEAMIRRHFPQKLEGFLDRNPAREFLSWTEEWTPDGSRLIVKNTRTRESLICFVSHEIH